MRNRVGRIAGTGRYLPARVVTNDALAERLAASDEWIRTRTGIRQRHIAADGEQTSDLALAAARIALQQAGIAAANLDLIIVATTTPDMIFPSTACILQEKLGAHGGPAFDVQAVCSGFVYALALADRMIASGMARNALVVGAEIYSRILDWNDRGTCVLSGDGAGHFDRALARRRPLSEHSVRSWTSAARWCRRLAVRAHGWPGRIQVRGESDGRSRAGSVGRNGHAV